MNFYLIHYPLFEDQNFTFESAFEYSFPKENYHQQKIIKLNSKLFKLLKTFVKCNALKEYGGIELLKFYNRRNLHQLFPSDYKQEIKELESGEIRNHRYFLKKFLFLIENAENYAENLDSTKLDIEELNMSFDYYLLSQKLYLYIHMLNQQDMTNRQSSFTLQTGVKELASTLGSSLPESLNIWLLTYQLYRSEKKTQYYFELKKRWERVVRLFDPDEVRLILTVCEVNIVKLGLQYKEIYEERLALYNFQLKNNLLGGNKKGSIPSVAFFNIILTALRLKKTEWAQQFYIENKKRVVGIDKNEIFALCLSKLYFAQKKFDGSLLELNKCNFTVDHLRYASRILRLKIYYELKLSRLVGDFVNSYRKYLSTKKKELRQFNVQKILPFITIANKLYFSNAETDFDALEEQINAEKFFLEKQWLLEKIEEKRLQFKKKRTI